jgi:hypothetical protein
VDLSSGDREYTVPLTYDGSGSFQVTGTAAGGAAVTYKIGGAAEGVYGAANTLSLTAGGSNKVYIRVTAANGLNSATYTVTVHRTKPIGGVVNFSGTDAVTLNLGGSSYTGSPDNPHIRWASSGSLIFTIAGSYDTGSLQWLVDNVDKTASATANSLTIQARSWAPKTYSLTVKGKKGGIWYSAVKKFTVTKE